MSNEEAFVNELIGYIFAYPDDDYMTMECLCRKLYKHGLIDKKDGEWTCNFIETVDTPQTDIHGLTDCDFCKGKNCEDCEGGKDEPQKKEVEWVYNKRERLWYPYSNGELLFKTENSSEKPNSLE